MLGDAFLGKAARYAVEMRTFTPRCLHSLRPSTPMQNPTQQGTAYPVRGVLCGVCYPRMLSGVPIDVTIAWGAMRLINPANTVPGPISTNSVTPWATM